MERSPPFLRCNKLGPLSCVLPPPLVFSPLPPLSLEHIGGGEKAKKKRKKGPLLRSLPSPPSLAPLVRTNALLLPPFPPPLPLLLSRVYSCRYIDRGLRCQSMQEWEDAGWDGEEVRTPETNFLLFASGLLSALPQFKRRRRKKFLCSLFLPSSLQVTARAFPPPKKATVYSIRLFWKSLFCTARRGRTEGEAWLCSVL